LVENLFLLHSKRIICDLPSLLLLFLEDFLIIHEYFFWWTIQGVLLHLFKTIEAGIYLDLFDQHIALA
jgi:hypothetical protein